jgi:hypothetical protein
MTEEGGNGRGLLQVIISAILDEVKRRKENTIRVVS